MKVDEAIAWALATCERMASIHGERRAARARKLALQTLAAATAKAAEDELAKRERALFAAIDDYFTAKDLRDAAVDALGALQTLGDAELRKRELVSRDLFTTTTVHVLDRATGAVTAMPITFRKDSDDDDAF